MEFGYIDKPEGQQYKIFGGIHYRFGRRLDGIPRARGGLTTERTYRLIYGSPEIYITCLYRWPIFSIADTLSRRSAELGGRLGVNKLLLPLPGAEEQFWADAQDLLSAIKITKEIDLRLSDTDVYLLITGVNTQLISDGDHPFLLFTITRLNELGLIAAFSKLLDLFNVKPKRRFFKAFRRNADSSGKALLSGLPPRKKDTDLVSQAVKALAELSVLLHSIEIQCVNFAWPIEAMLLDKTRLLEIDRAKAAKPVPIQLFLSNDDPSETGGVMSKTEAMEVRDFFLCHRSIDKEIVRSIAKALEAVGGSVWLDEAEIKWGDTIISKISSGIRNSRFVLVCVGKSFKTGNFAKYEVGLALTDEIMAGETKVLPLLLTTKKADTASLLSQVPSLRAKSYRTMEAGISALVQELMALKS